MLSSVGPKKKKNLLEDIEGEKATAGKSWEFDSTLMSTWNYPIEE
jgi:hypothetical protein